MLSLLHPLQSMDSHRCRKLNNARYHRTLAIQTVDRDYLEDHRLRVHQQPTLYPRPLLRHHLPVPSKRLRLVVPHLPLALQLVQVDH